MKIAILHGINLNMFGKREKKYYGTETLEDITHALKELSNKLKIEIDIFQSNSESDFVEYIHSLANSSISGIVINAGAWTHYSYGIADALAILPVPIVEVHMSNIFAREEFRKVSVISSIAKGVISGFGVDSYLLGLEAIKKIVEKNASPASIIC